jgi:hypothetical protein
MTPLAKRLAIAAAISIALNFLLAGLWLGRNWQQRQHHFAPPAASFEGRAARRHPILRRAFEGKAPEFAKRRKAAQASRARVAQSLEREPFERAAVDHALTELRAENARAQELMHAELAALAERSSPEQRRQIAKTFLRQRP